MRNFARLLVMLALAGSSAAFAQAYPNRPIKVIVPWPAGQNTDPAARIVTEKLASALGQPLVVDNRPGAGGVIGSEVAAKSTADGYTILVGSIGPISVHPHVRKVGYDPLKDFAPISLIATNPFVLVVNPSIPSNSVKELIAHLRANPGKYSFSSSGSGAISHLMTVLFNSMAQINAVHVPYKGSSQSVTDVASGQIAYTIESMPAIIAFVKGGRVRPLAVTSAKPTEAVSGLPTIAEAGDLPGYDMSGWIGFLAPAGTPRAVTERLSAEIRKVQQAPDIGKRFIALGLDVAGNTPDEFGDFLKKQNDRSASIVKQANVKAD